MLLLREFRYRFDPLWQPMDSLEAELREYFGIAWFWIPCWHQRPWRPGSFPLQPRSPNVRECPWLNEWTSREWRRLMYYHIFCDKIRQGFIHCRPLFFYPEVWVSCMANSAKPATLESADYPVREHPESQWNNFKFILTRRREDGDAQLYHSEEEFKKWGLHPDTLVETVTLNKREVTVAPLESI